MLFRRLFGMLPGKFFGDRGGNVAPIFALAMVPVIGFVGAAVDYSRAASARTSMQSALDATALFLSREAKGLSPEQVSQKGQEYFNSIFSSKDAKNVNLTTTFSGDGADFTVKVSATANVDTTIARVLGQDQMPIRSSAEVVWGMKRLEVALVLDNTTSMASQSRMVELKKATKSLIETLQKASQKPGDVKIAIIPYGTDVNVGTTYVNASWLEWGDGNEAESKGRWKDVPPIFKSWYDSSTNAYENRRDWHFAGPGDSCPLTSGDHGFGCANTTNGLPSATNNGTSSTIPSSGNYAGLICPSRDSGSRWTSSQQMQQAGVLTDRYYNGCWNSMQRDFANWYPVRTGSSASCGSVPSSQCYCSGSGSSRVCYFAPDSSWQSVAVGSSMSCGGLSSSICECKNQTANNNNTRVCKRKSFDHVWRPSENMTLTAAQRQDPINVRATPQPSARWNGCVRDRDQNYDVSDTTPASAATRFQPVQAGNCEGSSGLASVMPLTNNWSALKDKADALNTGNSGGTPVRYTNITIGLAWGWHALFNNEPLDQAEQPKDDLDKVIILMTDGDNTQNRWNRYDVNNSAIDARTELACSNFKATLGVKLYTVRLMEGNEALLKNCATKADMYYNVQQSSDLNAVFSSIAKNLASLRISK
jgi:Flp pilus assembly protein TadG